MKTEITYLIQYYGIDREWHYAKDGDYRIEVASVKEARKERTEAEWRYQRKARIVKIVNTEEIIK